MTLRLPIGIDDFRMLRERKLEYVDKSHLIQELLDKEGVLVSLIPRPRRFGKSLNLSMLRWFLEKRDENLWHLFEDLRIAQAGQQVRQHFQRYPVVYLSFKGSRANSLEVCRSSIRMMIREVYRQHAFLLDHPQVDQWQQADLRAILENTADEAMYRRSLLNLTRALHYAHGQQVVVLIDEYDAPIHSAYTFGYYDQIIDFVRGFFEAGLKDNPHLYKAVITGILRVAKESIFSGLNNPGVYTLLASEFNTCFGFTEAEVVKLLEKAGLSHVLDQVRAYYDGYIFGREPIYNPWSILKFLESNDRELLPYWVTTSSNDLVQDLLQHHAFAAHKDIEALLEGGSIEKVLDENVIFPTLRDKEDALWGLLVFSGYLKASLPHPVVGQPRPPAQLSIPNREVVEIYRTTFQSWMDQALKTQGGTSRQLLGAMLQGDVDEFQEQLQRLALYLLSYHDTGGLRPERFYHGLMIGLLAALEPDYEVRSNRESGKGRPDLWVKPRRPGRSGIILELKTARPDDLSRKRAKGYLDEAIDKGLDQIEQQGYEAELRTAGVEMVHAYAIAFDGKTVRVQSTEGRKIALAKRPKKTTRKQASRSATKGVSSTSRKKTKR